MVVAAAALAGPVVLVGQAEPEGPGKTRQLMTEAVVVMAAMGVAAAMVAVVAVVAVGHLSPSGV